MNKGSNYLKGRPLSPIKTPIGSLPGKIEFIPCVSPALPQLQSKSYLKKIHETTQSTYLKNSGGSVDNLIRYTPYQPTVARSSTDHKFSSKTLPNQPSVQLGRKSLSKSKLLIKIITPTTAFTSENGEYPTRTNNHISFISCHEELYTTNFAIYEKGQFPDYKNYHTLDNCINNELVSNQASPQELRTLNTETYENAIDSSILPRRYKTRCNRFDKFLARSSDARSKPHKRSESRVDLSTLLKLAVNPPRALNHRSFNLSKVGKPETLSKSLNLKDRDSMQRIKKKYYLKTLLNKHNTE